MLKKVVSILVFAVFVIDLFFVNGFGDIWFSGTRAHTTIQQAFPPEYQGYEFVYACDYGALRDRLIPAMEGAGTVANLSIAVFIGYTVSCAAAGAVGVAGGAEVVSGGTTVLTGTSASKLAYVAAQNSAAANRLSATFGAAVQNIVGADISTWLCGGTAEDFKRQAARYKTELGISDYFVFACAIKPSQVPLAVRMLTEGTQTLPLGAPMKIFVLPPTLDFNAPPPVIIVREPMIDFGKIGSSVMERSLTGETRPVTVPFVFAYEKFNGQMVQRQDGNRSVKVPVTKGDDLSGGQVSGRMNLSSLPGIGFGGLREVHLSSPVNMGMICKSGNDDFALALMLNKDTVMVQGPSYPVEPGKNLKIPIFIKGFHDNQTDIQTEDGQVLPWKLIAGQVLKSFSCVGAGISQTYAQDIGSHAELWCTPTKPGKVSVVIATRGGNMVFPDVATVGGASVEGLWKLRDNGSLIRIARDSKDQTYYAVLEEDHLQDFDKGMVMWKPIIPSPADPNLYDATETRWSGRGGTETYQIRLTLRSDRFGDHLEYQNGPDTAFLDRMSQ